MTDRSKKLKQLSKNDPVVRAVYKLASPISKYFSVEIKDIHHIPSEGGAMLVGNHALLGIDTWALLPELVAQTERFPRGMALKSLFDIPLVGRTLEHIGMVPGERNSAIELLQQDELVLTYPGGARDSLKNKSERYTLKWNGRKGFAHVAILAQRPIIPIVGAGPDECFHLLFERGVLPMRGLSQNTLKVPLFIPLARRIPFSFLVGEPIAPPEFFPDSDPDTLPDLTHDFARAVEDQTQSLLSTHASNYSESLSKITSRQRLRQLIQKINSTE